MQTFLPYSNFKKSAEVLDMKRLGKQRVEALQIMQVLLNVSTKKGWRNHPAVKMWKGHESTLLAYAQIICDEWTSRGYKDTCRDKIFQMFITHATPEMCISDAPDWLGQEEFHASHRSNLLRKKPEHYSQFNWKEMSNLEYVWPTRNT